MKDVKQLAGMTTPIITSLINKLFATNKISSAFKSSIIIPVFKKEMQESLITPGQFLYY